MNKSFIEVTQDLESLVCHLAPRHGDFQKRGVAGLQMLNYSLDRAEELIAELRRQVARRIDEQTKNQIP